MEDVGGGGEEVMVFFTYSNSMPPSLLPIKRGVREVSKGYFEDDSIHPVLILYRVGLRRGDLLKGSI